MSVTPISRHKLDPISEWMLKNDIPLTLQNWLELSYWKRVRLSDLGPEEICEIPRYYLPRQYQSDLPEKKAKVVPIR